LASFAVMEPDGGWLLCNGGEASDNGADLFVDVKSDGGASACPSPAPPSESARDTSKELHFLLKHCHYGHVRASVERCEEGNDSEFEVCLRDGAKCGRKLVSWRWPLSLPEREYRLRRQLGATMQKTTVGNLDGVRRLFACLRIGNHFFVYVRLAKGSLLLLDTVPLSGGEGMGGPLAAKGDLYNRTNWPVPKSYSSNSKNSAEPDFEQLHEEVTGVVAAFSLLRQELAAGGDRNAAEDLLRLQALQKKLGELWCAVREV